MNERQRRFAEAYAADPSATRAAIVAGYSKRTARSIGAENLTKPEILEYIKELQREAEGERVAAIAEVKEFWSCVMRDNDARTADRLKASELLAKSAGEFIQRVDLDATVEADVGVETDVVFYIPDNGRTIL